MFWDRVKAPMNSFFLTSEPLFTLFIYLVLRPRKQLHRHKRKHKVNGNKSVNDKYENNYILEVDFQRNFSVHFTTNYELVKVS